MDGRPRGRAFPLGEGEARLILAADIGGTNSRFALYPDDDPALPVLRAATLPTAGSASLSGLLGRFLGADASLVEAAGVAVAGPVLGNRCPAVNLPWPADGAAVAADLGLRSVTLLNDLVAAAEGIPGLPPGDLAEVLGGSAAPDAPAAVLAAGTGLGMAILLPDGRALPSEGGHSTFPARTPDEAGLRDFLARRHGTVSRERVVSGPGLAAAYEYLRERADTPPHPAVAAAEDPAAAVAEAALAGACPLCARALDLFVGAFGATAGDLALLALARGGMYLAGGIAPKIQARIVSGPFADAFLDKGRFRPLLRTIPVRIVLRPEVALRGAARRAAREAVRR